MTGHIAKVDELMALVDEMRSELAEAEAASALPDGQYAPLHWRQ